MTQFSQENDFGYFWPNYALIFNVWSCLLTDSVWPLIKVGHDATPRTVFENHRKSLIQHCERSELRLHFEWTKVN